MKKISIFLGAAAMMILASCHDLKFGNDFLEKSPGVDVTVDTIFSSAVYAEQALTAAYEALPVGLTIQNWQVMGDHPDFYQQLQITYDNIDCLTDILHSDCSWGGAWESYYMGNYSAAQEGGNNCKHGFDNGHTMAWKGIRRANKFIDNVGSVPDMDEALKTRRIAEAKLIIAICYADLLRHYGGVPILRSAVNSGNVLSTDFSRKSIQEVVDYIFEMCDDAAEVLPWSVPLNEDGRMCAAGAYALKARVLSFIASPLFNSSAPFATPQEPDDRNRPAFPADTDFSKMVWMGDYQESRWQAVVDACETFFSLNEQNGNAFHLVEAETKDFEGYRKAFSTCYADRGNGEIIIPTGRNRHTFSETYHYYYMGSSGIGKGYGGNNITLDYADMFPYADGEPSSYREWLAAHEFTIKTSDGRDSTVYRGTVNDTPWFDDGEPDHDPRLYESVNIACDRFRERKVEMWNTGQEYEAGSKGISGFTLRKFIWEFNDETCALKPCNFPYLRMADMYLMYAEALNEVGRHDDAMTALNHTRNRVGLPDMTPELLQRLQAGKTLPSYPDLTKGNPMLREEILDERAREFCLESCRWLDIARWKRTDILHTRRYGITITANHIDDPIPGSYLTSGGQTYIYYLDFSEPQPLSEIYWWREEVDPKWLLSALPIKEINIGYGLVQNPGW